METKTVPAAMKDAANVRDNFPLLNGCGTTLFYSFCCSVVATAMPPACSSSSVKSVDETSCNSLFFFFVIKCRNQTVFCVYSRQESYGGAGRGGGGVICSVSLRNSL